VLPDAMLPSAVVWLPSLPLTAAGKLDVRALPEPGDTARPVDGVSVPPRDMLEGLIAKQWEALLGRRDIGVHDHFFEIGGHSLLAARLVDAIEREIGCVLPLTALFEDDTIDALARRVREGAPSTHAPVTVVNEQGGRAPFVFMHGDFQTGGFYSGALARSLGHDQPTLIVHPHGLDGGAVPATIEAMAADRLRAVRALRPAGPYALGGHCNGALIAFEMARQLVAAGEHVSAVVLIESTAPGGASGDGRAGAYVKFDDAGRPRMLAARDRASDIELAYHQAIDRYAGGRYDGRVVVVQAQEWKHPAPDAGWSRHASDWEGRVVPGGHVTLITQHLPDLARAIGDAIGSDTTRRVPRDPG
jgi:thioesterase domain-containing protein/acyl carrier protein